MMYLFINRQYTRLINIYPRVICFNEKIDGMHSTLNQDLESERQLKLINKSPIKSIHVLHTHAYIALICGLV